MLAKILGSAAGGAFPQWNCACANCRAVRAGTFRGKPRTQTQVAITQDGHAWFLLGASPDLRAQIEATPELHPRNGVRDSPIAGVVLANADLDHVLGLLLLRELQPLRIHSTASVRRILRELNSCDVLLFDGTFFTDNELIRVQGSGQTVLQMGHIPVEQTLIKLAELRRPRKIFLHINNTNPILDEASPQYRQVRSAGWEVAEDGW